MAADRTAVHEGSPELPIRVAASRPVEPGRGIGRGEQQHGDDAGHTHRDVRQQEDDPVPHQVTGTVDHVPEEIEQATPVAQELQDRESQGAEGDDLGALTATENEGDDRQESHRP